MADELTSISIVKSLRAELNLEKALRERETLQDVNYSELIREMLAIYREHRPNAARPVVSQAVAVPA